MFTGAHVSKACSIFRTKKSSAKASKETMLVFYLIDQLSILVYSSKGWALAVNLKVENEYVCLEQEHTTVFNIANLCYKVY